MLHGLLPVKSSTEAFASEGGNEPVPRRRPPAGRRCPRQGLLHQGLQRTCRILATGPPPRSPSRPSPCGGLQRTCRSWPTVRPLAPTRGHPRRRPVDLRRRSRSFATKVLRIPARGMLPGHDTSPEAHPVMTVPATTMLTGPLGSTIHVLRADAGTIAELAAIDWNRHFPRVCLDPVRGIITLMAPSRLHDDLSGILDHVVEAAGSVLTGAARGLRSARLRGSGRAARHGDGAGLRVLRGRARQRVSGGPRRRGGGGRRLLRAHRAGSGGGGRDYARRRREGRALRRDGGA